MSGGRWWYPDTGFEPEHLAHTREFVAGLPHRDRIVAALVTGSRAAGLAHARSDLDIVVIVETEDDRRRFRTYPERHRDMTVDTDTLAVKDVERLLDDQRARETTQALDRATTRSPIFRVDATRPTDHWSRRDGHPHGARTTGTVRARRSASLRHDSRRPVPRDVRRGREGGHRVR
jgi:nucleotidyltransferase-like protein